MSQRRITLGVFVAVILSFSMTAPAFAGTCSRYEKDKVEYFAESAAKNIVAEFGGGRDIRVSVESCEFNSYSKKYKANIEVYWNGAVFRSNSYNVDGQLKVKKDGRGAEFSQTYANQAVKDLVFWVTVAAGTIVLADLASEY